MIYLLPYKESDRFKINIWFRREFETRVAFAYVMRDFGSSTHHIYSKRSGDNNIALLCERNIPTLDEAKARLDRLLIEERNCILLSEERAKQLELLV